MHLRGDVLVPEVTIFFDDVPLRGNRAVKVHADSYHGFASPNHPPLGTAGVTIEVDPRLIRAVGAGPFRRTGDVADSVAAMRLPARGTPRPTRGASIRCGPRCRLMLTDLAGELTE